METFVGCLISGLLLQNTPDSRNAANQAAFAYYKYEKWDVVVDTEINYIQKRYIPEIILKNSWIFSTTYSIVKDNKLQANWSF